MDRDLISSLADWADGKSYGLGLSAIDALASTESVGEFLHARRTLTGQFADEPNIDERQWRHFYNSPKSLERGLLTEMLGSDAGEASAVMDALRNPKRADKRSKHLALGLILAFFMKVDRSEWQSVLQGLLDDDEAASCSLR